MTSLLALSLLALLMPAQSQEKFPDYRLAALQIKDAKVFTAEELLAQFSIKPGDLVRIAEIKNGLEKIKAMYEDRGYINWSYVPEQVFDHPNKRMSLTFWLDEGVPHYVRRITVGKPAGGVRCQCARCSEADRGSKSLPACGSRGSDRKSEPPRRVPADLAARLQARISTLRRRRPLPYTSVARVKQTTSS
jgi:hypothetical protein